MYLLRTFSHSGSKAIANKLQLDPKTIVRLVYGGRIYQNFDVLESHEHWNFANNHVLTALVFL
jgi:hypothetical protein